MTDKCRVRATPAGMQAATVTMSTKELDRLHWMRLLVERRATQSQAATALGLSVRQVQRLRDALANHHHHELDHPTSCRMMGSSVLNGVTLPEHR